MLILTRDPVAARIDAIVVAPCTRTVRGLMSELDLGVKEGLPEPCVANFDNVQVIRRSQFRERITALGPRKMDEACRVLNAALGCV